MFNEPILVTVAPFSGTTTPDKNGKMPVILICVAGKMPNRNVLAGTVAERAGIKEGNTYLMQCRKSGYDKEFGDDFTFQKVMEVSNPMYVVELIGKLGLPQIIDVPRPEGFEDRYVRKTTAVEGLRTKRIKEGLYDPEYPKTSHLHETADEILNGTSTQGDSMQNLGADKNANEDGHKDLKRKL